MTASTSWAGQSTLQLAAVYNAGSHADAGKCTQVFPLHAPINVTDTLHMQQQTYTSQAAQKAQCQPAGRQVHHSISSKRIPYSIRTQC